MRFATPCLRVAAQLVLTLVPIGCSTSSPCLLPPGPIPAVTIYAPCDLTFTAVTASGACQQEVVGPPPSASLLFEGTGSGGTCNITVTLSNGLHTTLSVQFTQSTAVCYSDLTPSTDALFIDAGASIDCGATAPADASGG
jgi:hypothetical protein